MPRRSDARPASCLPSLDVPAAVCPIGAPALLPRPARCRNGGSFRCSSQPAWTAAPPGASRWEDLQPAPAAAAAAPPACATACAAACAGSGGAADSCCSVDWEWVVPAQLRGCGGWQAEDGPAPPPGAPELGAGLDADWELASATLLLSPACPLSGY